MTMAVAYMERAEELHWNKRSALRGRVDRVDRVDRADTLKCSRKSGGEMGKFAEE